MDFDNPAALVSAVLISLIGTAIFIYGKKQCVLKCLATGVALMVFPCLVHSVLVMWGLAGACVGGLYWSSRGAEG